MSTCTNCGQPIPYRSIVRAALPIWIACVECNARLVGDRSVQVAVIARSVLVVGLVMAYVFFLHFIGLSRSFQNDSYGGPEIPAAFLLTLLALPVLGLVAWRGLSRVAFRYGRYVVLKAKPRALGTVRRYLTATGAVSAIFMTWLTIYVGASPFGTLMLLSWAFVPFLLLYPAYDSRINIKGGKIAGTTLLLWAALINVWVFGFALFAVANYPKEGRFEGQLQATFGPQYEQDAWEQLVALIDNFDSPFGGRSGNYERQAAQSLSGTPGDGERGTQSASRADADEILEFLAQNIVSPPEYSLTANRDAPRLFLISSIAGSELEIIRNLMVQNAYSAATDRYWRLWVVADNLVSGHATLIQHLIGMSIASKLVDFHLDGANRANLAVGEELPRLSADLQVKLDESYANAMIYEYLVASASIRSLVPDNRNGDCSLVPAALCAFNWPWPFIDVNRTLRMEHQRFSRLVAMSREPFYRIASEIEAHGQEFGKGSRSIIRNSIGSVVLSLHGDAGLEDFLYTKERSKGKLSVLRYVLESSGSFSSENVPLDPLTGNPFALVPLGNAVLISSEDVRGGAPAISYEIRTDL